MDKTHISALDGFRGFAALIVFVSHYSNETGLLGGILGQGGGQIGVILFFVLAGFLMAYLYFEKMATPQAIGQYALRRVARVYPLFVVVAALPMVLLAIGYPKKVAMYQVSNFELYLRQILFIDRGVNVFWTIQVEMLFYVFFVAIWLAHYWGLRERYIMCALLVLGLLISLTPYGDGHDWIRHAHPFLFGVVLCSVCRRVQVVLPSAWMNLLGAVAIVGIFLSFPRIIHAVLGLEVDPWNSLIPIVPALVLMYCLVKGGGLLHAIFSSRWARFIGKISYSMYLLHYFVIMWVVSWTEPSKNYLVNFVGTFAVVILLSWASNRWIEVPMQRGVLGLPRRLAGVFKSHGPHTEKSGG